ncbi:type II and III secretion system protein family protein [Allopusillimonas ginsengisoli]|uniref:type II and III secretion system protein family protein n=1 Tax=Allopusillimonas ginsengisoli TaxID=453575 RepID=UPI0039C45F9A
MFMRNFSYVYLVCDHYRLQAWCLRQRHRRLAKATGQWATTAAMALLLTIAVPAQAVQQTLLTMQVGEVKVLALPDAARVAVGDGHVVHAVATDDKEVIVFARNEGSSVVQIWSADGRRREYRVEIAPEGARQAQRELQTLLARIPGARTSVMGDKLLVEGDLLSDEDRARVALLAQRYPQLLDLTGQVGWDSMVLLDVQVVEVPRSRMRELGLRWPGTWSGGVTTGVLWDAGTRHLDTRPGEPVLPGPFPNNAVAGYFGLNALLTARIQALAQSGEAVVLAQPQLLARSGATAEFLAGGEVPYSTVDADGNSRTVFKPYGVSLRITPQLERGGVVRSRIEVEVSAVDHAMPASNGPSLKTRRAVTEFNVRSGQTLVLAGFLSRESSAQVDGIPGLARLPLMGGLFRANRHQRLETELAVFVTPMLVSAEHPGFTDRIERSRHILNAAFPAPPLLNTSSPVAAGLPPPLLPDSSGWNPWAGQGSQWQDESDQVQTHAVGALPANAVSTAHPGMEEVLMSAPAALHSGNMAPPWQHLGQNRFEFKD